jgi:hypothetical protein
MSKQKTLNISRKIVKLQSFYQLFLFCFLGLRLPVKGLKNTFFLAE